jgi:hypothetical protein
VAAPTDEPPAEPSPGLRAFLTGGEDPGPGEPLASRRFAVAVPSRGEPRSRFVTEGGVLFRRATSYRLTVDDLHPMARRRPALAEVRLELVKFAFTFLELPHRRQYDEIRVRITLLPQAPVLQLRPRLKSAESQTTHSFSSEVAPTLSRLLQLEVRHSREASASRTEQQPVVTALDFGAEGFGWTYQAQPGAALVPRVEETVAVLELPADTTALAGTFDAEAVITRRILGILEPRSTVPQEPPVPFLLKLPSGATS